MADIAHAGYRKRVRILGAFMIAALLLSVGGLVGALWVKSPAQQAADTRPPARTVLSVPVALQVVSHTVVMRGVVTDTAEQQLTVPPPSSGTVNPLVTRRLTTPGKTVRTGQVVMEISGRPLVALAGSIPAYRDLRPGDQGADVAQMQQALAALGYADGGDPSGVFGPGTKDAVTQFYTRLGYDVPSTDSATPPQTDTSTVNAAQDAVTQAQRKLNDLLRTPPASGAPRGSSAPTPSGADSGGELIAEQISYARQDLETAQSRYRDAIATTGPMVPMSEIAFATLPARVVASTAVVGQAVKTPLLTLSTGAPEVVGRMNPSDAPLVRRGMAVTVYAESAGFTDRATVNAVGGLRTVTAADKSSSGSGSDTGSAVYLPVAIKPGQPIPYGLIGQDVRLTITSASTGKKVLAVPEAAITVTASGAASVITLTPSGTQTVVPITAGITGEGLVQVAPITPSQVHVGDRVVTSQ